MKKLVLLLTLLVSSLAFANNDKGLEAAKSWLSTIDAGNYTKSWDNAGAFLKGQLNQAKWQEVLSSVRAPLGNVISREKIASSEHSSLPGVPAGEYLIVQFQTKFEQEKSAVETLTLSKTEGQWFPVGYYIK